MDLFERAVVDKNVDEELWLTERRKGVTATEVSRLAAGQPAFRRDLIKEKLTGKRSFGGNKYTSWGLEREIFLSGIAEQDFGFEASNILFHAEQDRRHLATPDGIHLESCSILEIKTSKNDLNPDGKHFPRSPFYDQMQWQMHVTGDETEQCLFIWEQHDNKWVTDEFGVERPSPYFHQFRWIPRNDDRIAELILVANEFLAEIDWETA